mmetsp:Transcript_37160/g.102232  ORF Transcript_37160/g.102232 Transcript_37160/m.102232 type:complete len:218 (+) Transcript_37160:434-1087(+)
MRVSKAFQLFERRPRHFHAAEPHNDGELGGSSGASPLGAARRGQGPALGWNFRVAEAGDTQRKQGGLHGCGDSGPGLATSGPRTLGVHGALDVSIAADRRCSEQELVPAAGQRPLQSGVRRPQPFAQRVGAAPAGGEPLAEDHARLQPEELACQFGRDPSWTCGQATAQRGDGGSRRGRAVTPGALQGERATAAGRGVPPAADPGGRGRTELQRCLH